MKIRIFLIFRLKFPLTACIFPAMFLLAGCASVEKRIEANAGVFSSYPAEVQNRLRRGEIALGDDMKQVEIAKGKPTYVNLKKNADGEVTVWKYVMTRQNTRSLAVYSDDSRGADWINVSESEEIEVLRVEFRNGNVQSFEELQAVR